MSESADDESGGAEAGYMRKTAVEMWGRAGRRANERIRDDTIIQFRYSLTENPIWSRTSLKGNQRIGNWREGFVLHSLDQIGKGLVSYLNF